MTTTTASIKFEWHDFPPKDFGNHLSDVMLLIVQGYTSGQVLSKSGKAIGWWTFETSLVGL